MSTPLQDFDKQQAITLEANFIVGIDEAGRGPLAGPVVACACFIPPALTSEFTDVNDSKKLTEKRREEIYNRLLKSEVAYGIGFASAQEIDKLNILQATFLAMRRAAQKFVNLPHAVALIDGPYPAAGLTLRQVPIIDGDAKSLAIAAASIIAKVTRDRLMVEYDREIPGYGFASNKGYGSEQHIEALKKYGPSPIHRASFIAHFL